MLTRLDFFLDPGKGISRLSRIDSDVPPDNRPTVSGIIVTSRSELAISQSLVASRRPAFQAHGRRRRETKDSGVSKR